MIVGDLSPGDLAHRMAGPGLRLRTGPVVNRIESRLSRVVRGVALHYADHPVEQLESFADFHVRLAPPHSLRRWLKPQAVFQFDGVRPFLPLAASQAFAMLEWGLNWCVSSHCHQYLIVHAAAVERYGAALVLPGPPGSGKSTLCAGLVSRGWRLLSDELTLLEFPTGSIVPLPRPVSLKNASIEAIRQFSPGATLGPPVHDTVKGSVAHMKPPTESVHRATEAARPRWIALPRYERGATAQLTVLSKARTFMHLADNAFNYDVHGRRGFELLAQVISGSDCFEFRYGALEDAVAVFDDAARRA
jgi:HprK-related kinase A